jgi:hypothetical protein
MLWVAYATHSILTMHRSMDVKAPNNTRKWQMGFNSAFKGLILLFLTKKDYTINVFFTKHNSDKKIKGKETDSLWARC